MKNHPDPLSDCIDEFEERVDAGDLEGARAALARAREIAGEDDPDLRLASIELAYESDGPEVARTLTEKLVLDQPEHADAWYALAQLRADIEDDKGAIECFLRVAQLDAELDQTLPEIDRSVLDRIEQVAREVIEALPPELGGLLSNVPIVLEERPSLHIVREGFDPRSFGLFEGNEEGLEQAAAPTRIVLYTSCLVDAFGDADELEAQVEITVLHELG
ncbi:MAG: metallopeptidase family protein, partial [Polyangiaceae bacterium]|nr:metallopeptidase family protein [Polyangiaceae bacterium]